MKFQGNVRKMLCALRSDFQTPLTIVICFVFLLFGNPYKHAHLFWKYNVCGQLQLGSVLALKVDSGLMSACLLVYLDYWISSGYVYTHKQCFKLIFCFQRRPFWQPKIIKGG